MLTIFSVPKPFRGQIDIIQRNAIATWRRLHPDCEIILCGDEVGTDKVSQEFEVEQLTGIPRNRYGTPLLDAVFAAVDRRARHTRLCYVNTDIMLLGDFVQAVQSVSFSKYLLVGQRWDLEISEMWDFHSPNWQERLRKRLVEHGTLHPPQGSDFFVFSKACGLSLLPPFAVGRPGWDNWLIYNARKQHIPVVDLTKAATVIHQNHDYDHVINRVGDSWEGPEAEMNRAFLDTGGYVFTLRDATHILTARGVLSARSLAHLHRRLRSSAALAPEGVTGRLLHWWKKIRTRNA